jgi:hypothetical protein
MRVIMRVISCGAAAALFFCLAASATSENAYDGRWTVDFGESQGECAGAFRDQVTVAGGRVQYATNGATASGEVAPDGVVTGTIVRTDSRVTVSGRLTGNVGAGTWKASGNRNCAGRWSARRG